MSHNIKVAGRPLNESELALKFYHDEINDTDRFVPVTDHSKIVEIIAYRKALRDWQNSPSFPDGRPERNF